MELDEDSQAFIRHAVSRNFANAVVGILMDYLLRYTKTQFRVLVSFVVTIAESNYLLSKTDGAYVLFEKVSIYLSDIEEEWL